MADEEFEYEGFLGKMKAKGKGALILSASGGILLAGGGIYLATKNKKALEIGKNLADKGIKALNKSN